MGLPYQEAEAECEEAGGVPRVTWVVQCLLEVRRLLVCLCSVCWVQVANECEEAGGMPRITWGSVCRMCLCSVCWVQVFPFLFPPCAKPWAHESGVKGCGV